MTIETEVESTADAPHPRETRVLFGHAEAERALLIAYRSGHCPHAWLICGERGIGKATLAYRMARFVLAYPNPSLAAVQTASSLAVPADHPVTRRVATQTHSDLLVLERTMNEKGKLRQDIAVEDVRRCVPFFGSTAGEGGWRIAIVDAVDELNAAGANALLKIVEEPPPRALLFLVSHAPGRTLATIRSRCRRLALRPLSSEQVSQAAAAVLGKAPDDESIQAAARAADGSVARALMFLSGDSLELRRELTALLERLPELDGRALHALGDRLAGTEAVTLAAFLDTVNSWLSAQLAGGAGDKHRLARVAAAWEKVNRAEQETEIYNLDRRPLVFSVFGALAEAARG
ncbi:MAG TPA: DNA polymerase III subunit delta' [Xanthobacteraceae bacterium]|nr:DNA polymerase III subunit delta' [Xanthobacteraceae bacterium]